MPLQASTVFKSIMVLSFLARICALFLDEFPNSSNSSLTIRSSPPSTDSNCSPTRVSGSTCFSTPSGGSVSPSSSLSSTPSESGVTSSTTSSVQANSSTSQTSNSSTTTSAPSNTSMFSAISTSRHMTDTTLSASSVISAPTGQSSTFESGMSRTKPTLISEEARPANMPTISSTSTSTSNPKTSTSLLTSHSMSSIITPTTNGSHTSILIPIPSPNIISPPAPLSRTKQPIGAIVGGVLGGVFGLAIVAAFIFFYHRKRQNTSDLDLLRGTRNINASPSPSVKQEWTARVDAAMEEAAKQTERARSRAGSTPQGSNDGHHDTSGWQSPYTIVENWYGSPVRGLSPATPPPVPDIHHGEHLRSRSHLESSEEAGIEEDIEPADTLDKDFDESPAASVRTTRSRSLETNEEGFGLERERRREEIFERMRRVLDNRSDGFDPYGDGGEVRRESGSVGS